MLKSIINCRFFLQLLTISEEFQLVKKQLSFKFDILYKSDRIFIIRMNKFYVDKKFLLWKQIVLCEYLNLEFDFSSK